MSETGPTHGSEKGPKEPTVEDLVDACKGIIPEKFNNALALMEFDDALDMACEMLDTLGEDPIAFLMEKEILSTEELEE